MFDFSARFHTARLRLPAAVAGALATVIAAAALALGPGLAPAVAEEPATEAAKAEAVKRIMAGREFTVAEYHDPALCTPLLEDFQAQRGIEYIEPIARAERYHDPAFEPYRAMCPGLEFNRSTFLLSLPGSIIQRMSEDEREKLLDEGLNPAYFGTRNFKLYHLDIDNDPANGEEYVFYAERYYNRDNVVPWGYLHLEEIPWEVDWNDILRPEEVPAGTKFYDGNYTVLDLANCELVSQRGVSDPYDYREGRPLADYNGIVKHRSRHYIFDLSESGSPPGKDVYALWIDIFDGNYFESHCTFWQGTEAP